MQNWANNSQILHVSFSNPILNHKWLVNVNWFQFRSSKSQKTYARDLGFYLWCIQASWLKHLIFFPCTNQDWIAQILVYLITLWKKKRIDEIEQKSDAFLSQTIVVWHVRHEKVGLTYIRCSVWGRCGGDGMHR